MKKKIRIGIPRAFLYYKYYVFWKNFFEKLGCNVVLSPLSCDDILQKGNHLDKFGLCLPFKLYLGHINYLVDKCDYILLPNYDNHGKHKKKCMLFNSCNVFFEDMFSEVKVINYTIDYMYGKLEFFELLKVGFKFSKNIFKIVWVYFVSKYRQKKYFVCQANEQVNILKNDNLKVLIVSHPYIVYDEVLGSNIISFLNDKDIGIILSNKIYGIDIECYVKDFSSSLPYEFWNESIGSILYYKNAIDGIIFLSSCNCILDSMFYSLIEKNFYNIPILNLVLGETFDNDDVNAKLSNFIDNIKKGEKY